MQFKRITPQGTLRCQGCEYYWIKIVPNLEFYGLPVFEVVPKRGRFEENINGQKVMAYPHIRYLRATHWSIENDDPQPIWVEIYDPSAYYEEEEMLIEY